MSDEGSLCSLLSQTHLSHEAEVLAAPAGGQDGQGDGAGHTDQQHQEEVHAGLVAEHGWLLHRPPIWVVVSSIHLSTLLAAAISSF